MSFQIRHKEMGVYQGSFLGLGLWHPMSDSPEQGFCEFPTREEAELYVDFLCSDQCETPHLRDEFTIEPYDAETSERLQRVFL